MKKFLLVLSLLFLPHANATLRGLQLFNLVKPVPRYFFTNIIRPKQSIDIYPVSIILPDNSLIKFSAEEAAREIDNLNILLEEFSTQRCVARILRESQSDDRKHILFAYMLNILTDERFSNSEKKIILNAAIEAGFDIHTEYYSLFYMDIANTPGPLTFTKFTISSLLNRFSSEMQDYLIRLGAVRSNSHLFLPNWYLQQNALELFGTLVDSRKSMTFNPQKWLYQVTR